MANLPDPVLQGNPSNNSQKSPVATPSPSSSGVGLQKEKELSTRGENAQMEEIRQDIELEPELEKIGVETRSEKIEIPPDLQKMGISATGPAQPVISTQTIQMPLSDEEIELGLHTKILTSIRWLAEWCVRQLKMLHIHLKKVAGKVVREKD